MHGILEACLQKFEAIEPCWIYGDARLFQLPHASESKGAVLVI
jgi:hypothetical protein